MTDINPVGTSASATTLREFAAKSSLRVGDAGRVASSDDSVEISELAGFLNRLAQMPDARAKKIVEVRNAIASGQYETPAKLDLTTERLLDAFSPDS